MTGEDAPISSIEIKGAFVQNAVITVEFEDGIYRDTENMRFQWYRNDVPENFGGEPILGAARSEYTLTSEDVGEYLYVSIPDVYIAGDNPSDKIPAVSSVTDKISDSMAELKSISIDKNNEIVRNKKIRVIAAQPENALAKVQWYRNDIQSNISGEPILGANYETYVPVAEDVGKYLYCVYTPVSPFSGEPVVSEVYAGKFDNPKHGHSVQAFIWDDMQFMKPLSNVGKYRL